jgi:hypothetical protein
MLNLRQMLVPAIACALLLAGCTATPEASRDSDADAKRFDSAPGSATVYLYRADGPDNRGFTTLWLDGRLIGEITPASYFRVNVRPGKNALTAYAGDNGRLEFETRSDGVYYVAISVRGGYGAQNSTFSLVSPEVGRAQILRCCNLLETWKPGQTRIPL